MPIKLYLTLLVVPILLVSCSSYIQANRDPAVRLASCINMASITLYHRENQDKLETECDTELAGEYLVILHPARAYSDDEFMKKGLSIATIRKLKLFGPPKSSNGRIMVIPLFTDDMGSKTTGYGQHIVIPEWRLAQKATKTVTIELSKTPANAIVISSIK